MSEKVMYRGELQLKGEAKHSVGKLQKFQTSLHFVQKLSIKHRGNQYIAEYENWLIIMHKIPYQPKKYLHLKAAEIQNH